MRTCAASRHTFPRLLGYMILFLMHFVGNLGSLKESGEEPQIPQFVASPRQLSVCSGPDSRGVFRLTQGRSYRMA